MTMKKYSFYLLNILSFLFLCVCCFALLSCDIFNVPVREFFEESYLYGAKSEGGNLNNNGDSENSDDDTISLNTYYVASTGSASAKGSKNDPFTTVDEALTALKQSLLENSTLTEGFIYLKSDIEITNVIDFSAYKFGDLNQVCSLTIAGYGGVRTIDANYNCRVLQIGWTNGNVNIENLVLKQGTTTDNQGGAGLFISSVDAAGKKVSIKNCKFINNKTDYTGTAILIKSNYEVAISDCEISGNQLTGNGAAAIEAIQNGTFTYITIANTNIKNNSVKAASGGTYKFGFVMNGDAYTKLLAGVTINNNSITNVPVSISESDDNLCAVYNTLGLKIAGKSIIKDNIITRTDSSSSVRNIVLPLLGTMISPKISLLGNLAGSSIGVSVLTSSIASNMDFTSGYSTSGTTSVPASIFVSDCNFTIGASNSGEAAFLVSGGDGNTTNPLGITMSFTVSPETVAANSAASITVMPSVLQNGTDITASVLDDILWSIIIKSGSSLIMPAVTSNVVTIAAPGLEADCYTLNIFATLNGITYDDSVNIIFE